MFQVAFIGLCEIRLDRAALRTRLRKSGIAEWGQKGTT